MTGTDYTQGSYQKILSEAGEYIRCLPTTLTPEFFDSLDELAEQIRPQRFDNERSWSCKEGDTHKSKYHVCTCGAMAITFLSDIRRVTDYQWIAL